MEFLVGTYLVQRATADYTADAGNGAVWSYRMSVFSKSLFVMLNDSRPFTSLT